MTSASKPSRQPGPSEDDVTRRTGGSRPDLWLVFAWEHGQFVYPLHRIQAPATLVIGRGANADIRIQSDTLSRQHARVQLREGDVWVVEDLASANGTHIGDQLLTPNRPVTLSPGITVTMGSVRMTLQAQSTSVSVDPNGSPSSGQLPTTAVPSDGAMAEIYSLLERVAPGDVPITLVGETGVGKDVIARRIHAISRRAAGPFVTVNCATLPDTLFESELFGHEKGAFSGATATKRGLLDDADGGTVFLDEIGEMPLGSQAKMLRFLETREVRRLGATRVRTLDVRFIAATNRDLERDANDGRFRRDLFFRLAGVLVAIPPLRQRLSEISSLVETFLANDTSGSGEGASIEPQTLAALLRYPWPGNIRELRNIVEAAALVAGGHPIDVSHLPVRLRVMPTIAPHSDLLDAPTTLPSQQIPRSSSLEAQPVQASQAGVRHESQLRPDSLRDELADVERHRIEQALTSHNGNQTRAAAALGISRRALISRLEQYGFPRPRKL